MLGCRFPLLYLRWGGRRFPPPILFLDTCLQVTRPAWPESVNLTPYVDKVQSTFNVRNLIFFKTVYSGTLYIIVQCTL